MSWIEVVDATGRLVARRAAEGVPCTVGSAADNALLLEGPDVAEYHARIDREADGGLTVTVLGQSPGLQRPGAPERAMSLALTPSAPVALGGNTIRLVGHVQAGAVQHAPAATAATGWLAVASRRSVQWGAAAFLALGAGAIGYLTMPGSDRAVNAIMVASALVLAECAWVGLWAIAGRIRHGVARFGEHFVVATVVALLGWVVGEFESWQKFLLPGARVLGVVLLMVTAMVWMLAIFAHLRVMSQSHRAKHVRVAIGAGITLFLLVAAARNYEGPWSSDVEFSSVLKPIVARFVPAKDAEQFSASLETLQSELDREGDEATPVAADEAKAPNGE